MKALKVFKGDKSWQEIQPTAPPKCVSLLYVVVTNYHSSGHKQNRGFILQLWRPESKVGLLDKTKVSFELLGLVCFQTLGRHPQSLACGPSRSMPFYLSHFFCSLLPLALNDWSVLKTHVILPGWIESLIESYLHCVFGCGRLYSDSFWGLDYGHFGGPLSAYYAN